MLSERLRHEIRQIFDPTPPHTPFGDMSYGWETDLEDCLKEADDYGTFLDEEIRAAVCNNDTPASYLRALCAEKAQITVMWKQFVFNETYDPYTGS